MRSIALGRVASGIVHDIKNPLNAMALQIALLGEKLSSVPDAASSAAGNLSALRDQVASVRCLLVQPERESVRRIYLGANKRFSQQWSGATTCCQRRNNTPSANYPSLPVGGLCKRQKQCTVDLHEWRPR